MTFELEARFGLNGPDYPPATDFGGRRCNLNFKGRKAAALATSEVKTEARFRLSGPDNLLDPVFEAEIGPF